MDCAWERRLPRIGNLRQSRSLEAVLRDPPHRSDGRHSFQDDPENYRVIRIPPGRENKHDDSFVMPKHTVT